VWQAVILVIVPESFTFAKDYHSQTFSHELEKVNNSQTFSFADYSRYTISAKVVVNAFFTSKFHQEFIIS